MALTLAMQLRHLFLSGDCHDVSLTLSTNHHRSIGIPKSKISVANWILHRSILSARSPFFGQAFESKNLPKLSNHKRVFEIELLMDCDRNDSSFNLNLNFIGATTEPISQDNIYIADQVTRASNGINRCRHFEDENADTPHSHAQFYKNKSYCIEKCFNRCCECSINVMNTVLMFLYTDEKPRNLPIECILPLINISIRLHLPILTKYLSKFVSDIRAFGDCKLFDTNKLQPRRPSGPHASSLSHDFAMCCFPSFSINDNDILTDNLDFTSLGADVVFTVCDEINGKHYVSGIQSILACRSAFFRSMFVGPWRNQLDLTKNVIPVISIGGISYNEFDTIVRFCLTDDLHLSCNDEAFTYHHWAAFYDIASLSYRCESFLASELTADTACLLWETALALSSFTDEQGAPHLAECCQDFVGASFGVVSKTPSFLLLRRDNIHKLLLHGRINESNSKILHSLTDWARAQLLLSMIKHRAIDQRNLYRRRCDSGQEKRQWFDIALYDMGHCLECEDVTCNGDSCYELDTPQLFYNRLEALSNWVFRAVTFEPLSCSSNCCVAEMDLGRISHEIAVSLKTADITAHISDLLPPNTLFGQEVRGAVIGGLASSTIGLLLLQATQGDVSRHGILA